MSGPCDERNVIKARKKLQKRSADYGAENEKHRTQHHSHHRRMLEKEGSSHMHHKHHKPKHKHKHREKPKLFYGRYQINATDHYKVRLRHHSGSPYFGRYTPDSVSSILEPAHTSTENKNFERWKAKHWASMRSAVRKPHASSSIHELRRWDLERQREEKGAHEHWSRTNAIREWDRYEELREARHKAKVEAKATLLASNRWPIPDTPPPQLPQFAYHRVTSPPSASRGGRSPSRRSAYVAVSLVSPPAANE